MDKLKSFSSISIKSTFAPQSMAQVADDKKEFEVVQT